MRPLHCGVSVSRILAPFRVRIACFGCCAYSRYAVLDYALICRHGEKRNAFCKGGASRKRGSSLVFSRRRFVEICGINHEVTAPHSPWLYCLQAVPCFGELSAGPSRSTVRPLCAFCAFLRIFALRGKCWGLVGKSAGCIRGRNVQRGCRLTSYNYRRCCLWGSEGFDG